MRLTATGYGRCGTGKPTLLSPPWTPASMVHAWKVAGQRLVIAIVNADSHDELDAILMAGLPMAHHLEIEEVLPVREYRQFAADLKRRWQSPGVS